MYIPPGVLRVSFALCTLIAVMTFGAIGLLAASQIEYNFKAMLLVASVNFFVTVGGYCAEKNWGASKDRWQRAAMTTAMSVVTGLTVIWAANHVALDASIPLMIALVLVPVVTTSLLALAVFAVASAVKWTGART